MKSFSEATRQIKRDGVHRALKLQTTKLRELMAALPDSGVVPPTHVEHIRNIDGVMRNIRDLNVCLGYLSGIQNKTQAKIYGVTEARISQIVKTIVRG